MKESREEELYKNSSYKNIVETVTNIITEMFY